MSLTVKDVLKMIEENYIVDKKGEEKFIREFVEYALAIEQCKELFNNNCKHQLDNLIIEYEKNDILNGSKEGRINHYLNQNNLNFFNQGIKIG